MQQVTITLNNPILEKDLLNLSKNSNKSVNHILSDIIEHYLSSYQTIVLKKKEEKDKKMIDDFFEFMENNPISIKTDKITREWIHDNPEKYDLHRQ